MSHSSVHTSIHRSVESHLYQIHYDIFGDENDKNLLLCHGLAASGKQFSVDAAFFAGLGYRVIVPDLRGHGLSKAPDKRQDSDFSIAQMSRDLLKVLDAENVTETNWVGNSLGGILALSLMSSAPERLKRFVCFGTAFAIDVPENIIPITQFAHDVAGRKLFAKTLATFTSWEPDAHELIDTMLAEMDPDAVARISRNVRKYDMISNARAFEKPMFLIKCENDRAVNLAMDRTLEAMREVDNFSWVYLKGAGHVANLDQPQEFRALLVDFLQGSR